MRRRHLLIAVAAVMTPRDPPPLAAPAAALLGDTETRRPVRSYAVELARLCQAERDHGGVTSYPTGTAMVATGERMMQVSGGDPAIVRVVAWAHQATGWMAADAGRVEHGHWHLRRALRLARTGGDRLQVAAILASQAQVCQHYDGLVGADQALPLLRQAAELVDPRRQAQPAAVLAAMTAGAYATVGTTGQADAHIRHARWLIAGADPDVRHGSAWDASGRCHGLLGLAETELGRHEAAEREYELALRRPDAHVRGLALNAASRATNLLAAGEINAAIRATDVAVRLGGAVDSQRVRDRLGRLCRALAGRSDSTCQNLARQVRLASAVSV